MHLEIIDNGLRILFNTYNLQENMDITIFLDSIILFDKPSALFWDGL